MHDRIRRVRFFFDQLARFVGSYFEGSERSIETNEKKIAFRKRWGSYDTLDNAANGDRTKFDFYLSLPLDEWLTYISYLSDKAAAI